MSSPRTDRVGVAFSMWLPIADFESLKTKLAEGRLKKIWAAFFRFLDELRHRDLAELNSTNQEIIRGDSFEKR